MTKYDAIYVVLSIKLQKDNFRSNFSISLTSVTQCEAILRNLGGQLPDAVDELELGDRHGQVEDGVWDPALVLAVHQPDELAAGRIVGQGSNHLSSGTVPSPSKINQSDKPLDHYLS